MATALSSAAGAQRNATWLRSPQRVWLRRAIFQIHLWAGVTLALYSVVIGLSGSALVFRAEIEDLLDGGVRHIAVQSSRTTMAEAVQQIVAARPGWLAVGLENLDKLQYAATLLMRPKDGPAGSDRMVAFNPYTGQVLSDRMRYAGVMGWMTNLHFYLLAGPTGLQVSGWMALGLLLLCASGLVLWWPGIRRWKSALVLHRRSSWQRVNWDLHVVVGFWCVTLLSVVTVTGVYFAFPDAVQKVVIFVTGGSLAKPFSTPPMNRVVAAGVPMLTIDEALASARQALPIDAPPSYLQFPASAAVPYSATGYHAGTAPYSQLAQVTLDSRSGAVLALSDTRQDVFGMRLIQYSFAVHFGSFGGVASKLLWVLLGISPAVLAVTGLLMYWNRKLRPLWRLSVNRRPA